MEKAYIIMRVPTGLREFLNEDEGYILRISLVLFFCLYFDEWIRKLIVYFENNAEFNSINGTIYL